MEEILVRISCDYCKNKESLSMKYTSEPFLDWHRVKIRGSNKVVNLCSNACLEKYVMKIIDKKIMPPV